jgi:hypothetical protein
MRLAKYIGENHDGHNNGMHPTRVSLDAIRKAGCLCQFFQGGRYLALDGSQRLE